MIARPRSASAGGENPRVESVQGVSGDMQFVAAASRTQSDDYKAFCYAHHAA